MRKKNAKRDHYSEQAGKDIKSKLFFIGQTLRGGGEVKPLKRQDEYISELKPKLETFKY